MKGKGGYWHSGGRKAPGIRASVKRQKCPAARVQSFVRVGAGGEGGGRICLEAHP